MKILEKPTLPKEIFQVDAAPQLLAQAVRVYLANQRQGNQSAKTRADVNRTRHKLYKQKGTGGARHGDRKAPTFVGGGVTFAPKPRDHSLSLPFKMRQRALAGALTLKNKEKKLAVVSAATKLSGKTSEVATLIPKNSLIVTDIIRQNVYRAARNIPGVIILPMDELNVYSVLKADQVFIMEEVFEKPASPAGRPKAKKES